VHEFTAGPRYPGGGRRARAHQYVVEFERAPEADLEPFAAEIDRKLQEINHDYCVKRKGDLGMTCVEVTAVPQGTFYDWMKARGKLGGQHKVPVCANDRQYVDELLKQADQALYQAKENGRDRVVLYQGCRSGEGAPAPDAASACRRHG